jgi:hypothetical protein
MFGPIGHGFGVLAGIFGAIVWAIGTFILLLIVVALIVLLARFLWFGTKASRRYLELNGSPAPMRMSTPAAPAAAPTTTAAPAAKAPSAAGRATAPAAKRGAGGVPPAKS